MSRDAKIIWSVMGLGACLVAGLVYLVFWATSGLADATELLAERIADEDYAAIYDDAAPELKREVSEAELRQALIDLGVAGQLADLSITQRNNSNGIATVSGTWRLLGASAVPFAARYRWGEDRWLLISLRFQPS